jgi:hypothetical protein
MIRTCASAQDLCCFGRRIPTRSQYVELFAPVPVGSRMVVRIRLARHGRRNRAFYRIVAADSRSPRDGRFLEVLGFYNPHAHSRQEVS